MIIKLFIATLNLSYILVCAKLMRFNRPKAKICFKSNLNHLLIDFFDSNLSSKSELSQRNWLQQLRNTSTISNLIKRDQKYIERDQVWSKKVNLYQLFWTFLFKFDYFNLWIDFFDLLIKNRTIQSKRDRNKIKTVIDDTILTLKSE